MARFWILVADHSRARIFATDERAGALQEIDSRAHPEGRLREREFATDAPGDSFSSAAPGRHAMTHEKSGRHTEGLRFAHELADTLEQSFWQKDYQNLYLVCSPVFLGELRSVLPEVVQKTVRGEIHRELTTMTPEQIRAHLPDLL